MANHPPLRAVVLAGGSGTRLWPISRLESPKQFSLLMGDETLLEATIARLHPMVERNDVLVVTSAATSLGDGYRALEPYEKLLEPVARGTAPAIGIAALRYVLEGIDPVMIVLPSDHVVTDVPGLHAAIQTAVAAASEGRLVTLGITPRSPETGFGYLQSTSPEAASPVTRFHEKPDRATAEAFLREGGYYWNSGMFVWRASAILREIAATLPDLARTLDDIRNASGGIEGLQAAIDQHFASAPAISIDRGVLEKSRNVYMVRGDFGWSDVGTWDALHDISPKDAEGNVLEGNVVAIECHHNLVRSHGRLVAALGVDNLTIVETRDAVLVARRGAGQEVGRVVEELERRAAGERLNHLTVQRQWGHYTVTDQGDGYKTKHIVVRPYGRLSLQRHRHRSEHWVVVSGEAAVTCNGEQRTLGPNESTWIPAGALHRLENRGEAPLVIVEIQVGSYVGEDDIERFADPGDEIPSTKR